mmetsp:Transcript_13167/g.42890  ORF Transcript_13167/g.42890 Transcript_13167/m.42890 type:complete len:245 (-) Transcript_13167:1170-1904(-)|eukprot:CAMPEP_0118894342 /NCGR_PEP_ID=MMETSP1166-20130328/3151_1 /TAXON_ID=1104430 /ORGANISM="Chrysoreinhardia sp, Strain CCMP3193" /LENGTH=244 /DNA_ID=CAMNT_0006833237 /DNA_START=53 /DNA_END=787 /DNA_ORIENTATION=-
MKFILLASVPAFAFNFGAKPAAKKAATVGTGIGPERPSEALPWTTTVLDGTYIGDVGFDPLGFSKYAPGAWWFGEEGDGSLKIFREAELIHGRIAQLAALGWIFPEIYHWPGNDKVGVDAYAELNPYKAIDAIPSGAWLQILAFMSSLEILRLNRLKNPDYIPGDLGLGQGEGRWNPFGFNYTPEEYEEKQLQELNHCRVAMLGMVGLAAKSSGADMGVLAQLGQSFSTPDFVAKAGYYFPVGI